MNFMTRTQVMGAIAFVFLAIALVLGTALVGPDKVSTPFVTTVLGFIGLAVTQLLSHAKTEQTDKKVTKLSKDLHNGTIEELVRSAIERIAHDSETSLEIKHDDVTETHDEAGKE